MTGNRARPSPVNISLEGKPRVDRRNWIKTAMLSVTAVVVILLIWEILHIAVGGNVHVVVPGRVYRCSQPNRALLQKLVRRYGIKTVVNLRGICTMMPWYQEEVQATADLDLCQEDISLSAGRLPSVTELRQVIKILDRAEYPILLHCRQGADRTGLISVLVLLLRDGVSYDEARGNLSWRYGHVALGRPARMARFFDYYEDWLEQQRLVHSPKIFRRWVLEEYRGGHCSCTIEEHEFCGRHLPVGESLTMKIKARNSGSRPWRLSPFKTAGVQLCYVLYHPNGHLHSTGQTGFYDAVVAPGEKVEFILPIAPVNMPGRYRLVVDMYDPQIARFSQMGSEPLELRLRVGE